MHESASSRNRARALRRIDERLVSPPPLLIQLSAKRLWASALGMYHQSTASGIRFHHTKLSRANLATAGQHWFMQLQEAADSVCIGASMHLHGVSNRKYSARMSTEPSRPSFSKYTRAFWLGSPEKMVQDQINNESGTAPERSSFPETDEGREEYEAKKAKYNERAQSIEDRVMQHYRRCYTGLRSAKEIQEQLYGDEAKQKKQTWESKEVMTCLWSTTETHVKHILNSACEQDVLNSARDLVSTRREVLEHVDPTAPDNSSYVLLAALYYEYRLASQSALQANEILYEQGTPIIPPSTGTPTALTVEIDATIWHQEYVALHNTVNAGRAVCSKAGRDQLGLDILKTNLQKHFTAATTRGPTSGPLFPIFQSILEHALLPESTSTSIGTFIESKSMLIKIALPALQHQQHSTGVSVNNVDAVGVQQWTDRQGNQHPLHWCWACGRHGIKKSSSNHST